jgi:hypothetical protein
MGAPSFARDAESGLEVAVAIGLGLIRFYRKRIGAGLRRRARFLQAMIIETAIQEKRVPGKGDSAASISLGTPVPARLPSVFPSQGKPPATLQPSLAFEKGFRFHVRQERNQVGTKLSYGLVAGHDLEFAPICDWGLVSSPIGIAIPTCIPM